MSQYGARAQAEDGRGWRQILEHYYTGVGFGDVTGKKIRVLLTSGTSMVAGGPEGVIARWKGGGEILRSTDAEPYVRVRPTDGGVAIDRGASATGSWRQVASGTGTVRFTPERGPAVPVASGSRLKYYRGTVEAFRRSATVLYAINQLPVDSYLGGVVPREMPSSWHADALRAQAVAARSYTMWKRQNAGSSAPYHICATTMCQVYGGYGERSSHGGSMNVLERSTTNDAIEATAGVIMTDAGKAIFAEYHSSSGGHTAAGSRAYLAPVPDPWDERYSPHHRWIARITAGEIEDRWRSVGRLTGLTVAQRDGKGPWGGRVDKVTVAGTDGTVTVSGDTFRASFWWPNHPKGIRSRLFTVSLYDAEPVGAMDEIVLSPGGSAEVTVRMRNTGSVPWPVGEDVALVTANGPSAFAARDWTSPSRVGFLTAHASEPGKASVGEGEVGEIRFTIAVPRDASSGLTLERFELHAGGGRFGEPATVPVRVRTPGASHLGANVVANPSFDASAGSVPAGWAPLADEHGGVRDTASRLDGKAALRIAGDPGVRRGFIQTVREPAIAGERFVLSAWNRSEGTTKDGNRIDVTARFFHVDGTITPVRISFPQKPHGWTYREQALDLPRDAEAVEVSVNVRKQPGSAWFDRVRLARDALTNGGFEDGTEAWTLVRAGRRAGIDQSAARGGEGALRIPGRDANAYARQGADLRGVGGETYRLAGWNRSQGTDAAGGPVRLWARVRHVDGSFARHRLDFPRQEHGWRYGELMFTTRMPHTGIDVFAKVKRQDGTVWFDEVSLARAWRDRSLAANPDFEIGDPKPGDWILRNAEAAISTAASVGGDASLLLPGDAERTVYARQRVPVAGVAGDRYRLTGWNRTTGSSGDGGPVRVWARVRYLDGTAEAFRIDFPRDPHGWVEGVLRFTTAREYHRIEVFSKFERQSGRAWFDGVRLERVADR